MRKIVFILFQIITWHGVYAQAAPVKIWDKTFGGSLDDDFLCSIKTRDGGFILGGESFSPISGDKTQPNWDTTFLTSDYWLVKIDSFGNKQWDKRFGGLDLDIMQAIQQTSDGGYIIGGLSYSNIGGDKTQNNWGDADFWVLKIDSNGVKIWDQRYGGSNYDDLVALQQTRDGGYILGGYTESSISGDISDTGRGLADYLIIKVDAFGHRQWDKLFGTSSQDIFESVIQTFDGGYIVGGYTPGGVSGDKTQPLKDSNNSGPDYWVIKADSLGAEEWDQDYGGPVGNTQFATSFQPKDSGYIMAGTAFQPDTGGDKSQYKSGYWIIKTDPQGNRQWDRTYSNGFLMSACLTSDGGFLLGGEAINFPIPTDKTEPNLGSTQSWIVKTDSLGNKEWDRTIFTNDSNINWGGGIAMQSIGGRYGIANTTNVGVGGYKTQPSRGGYDYFIVKMGDSVLAGIQEPEGNMHLLVYPNPTSADLTINIQKDDLKEASFILTNATGQTIYQSSDDQLAHSYTKILDFSSLPSGVYVLEVIVDDERIVKKVLKE